MEKNLYKIRFWVPYCDYTHIIDVDEFMNGVFGETAPRFYFECYIHDRLHECYIDVKEMTLTITPIENDGETAYKEYNVKDIKIIKNASVKVNAHEEAELKKLED